MTLVIGELSDAHDILSMKMFELEGATTKQTDEERRNAQPKSEYFESPRDHVDDPKPSSMSGNIFEKDIAPMNKLENSFKYAYFTINILLSYRYQNILSSVAGSIGLLCLRCNRNNDLSEAARKLEKTILLSKFTSAKMCFV